MTHETYGILLIGYMVALLVVTYLWMYKIIQQYLYEMKDRLLDIQRSNSDGIISLAELALMASNNIDTTSISELDIPEGLIDYIESLQSRLSFSPKSLFLCYKAIVKEIEPKVIRWEKEILRVKADC